MSRTAVPRRVVLGLAALAAAPRHAQAAEMAEHALPSPALGRSWAYSVYLPDGYAAGTRHHPVIYFLPGLLASRSEWAELTLARCIDASVATGTLPRPIVVVPELGASWGIDGPEKMQTALLDDLMPAIEQRYRILPGPEGRALAGISAGGFAALRLALLRPERFAALALLSPAIYHPEPPAESGARRGRAFGERFDAEIWRAHNYPALLPRFVASGARLPVYIGTGDADRLGIAAHAATLQRVLQDHGQPAELHVVPGGHTYAVWKQLLASALPFLLARLAPDRTLTHHSAAVP